MSLIDVITGMGAGVLALSLTNMIAPFPNNLSSLLIGIVVFVFAIVFKIFGKGQ